MPRCALWRHSGLTAAAVVSLGLVALCPKASLARQSGPATSRPPSPPAESALTGGLATLRAPASLMLKVAASTFRMGSTIGDVLGAVADCAREPLGHRCREELFSDEMEAHLVTLDAYWLDRTEVTVAEYAHCVRLGRCRPIPFSEGARRFDIPNFPASLVTWNDAQDYCRFRGARLPTEAEFERAARGAAGRRYPWGDLWNSRAANHGRLGLDPTSARDGFAELAPVGSFPAGRTPDGFLDLAGNVGEWTADRYATSYPSDPVKNPTGPASGGAGSERVVRGGHYSQAPPWLRGAARGRAEPGHRSPTLGLRCAKSAKPQ